MTYLHLLFGLFGTLRFNCLQQVYIKVPYFLELVSQTLNVVITARLISSVSYLWLSITTPFKHR